MKKIQLKIINFFFRFFSKLLHISGKRKHELQKLRYFTEFEERKDDIYIATFLKSGTTWTQMIVYLLFNDKVPDFDHIYDVSPWLSNEAFLGKSAERVNQLPSPRFFKSHDKHDKYSPEMEGKVIYVYRNVEDLVVSLLHHERAYKRSDIQLEEIIDKHFSVKKGNSWFKFHGDWLRNENGLSIHYIRYEDWKNNFDTTLQSLANFLNINLTAEKMEFVKKYSSFEYMKEHETKFGEQPKREDERVFNQFIRKGEVGEGNKELTIEQQHVLKRDYEILVKPLEIEVKK
ncbi:MAG: sulfotransferase domain-containing protein [Chitinophagales bacterium]